MSFILSDLQRHPAPRISHHESIAWRSVTAKMPLVTKTNFLIGGFCHKAPRGALAYFLYENFREKEPEHSSGKIAGAASFST
jgi:hypothetical protein